MPIKPKFKKILDNLIKQYGSKKGTSVFYAMVKKKGWNYSAESLDFRPIDKDFRILEYHVPIEIKEANKGNFTIRGIAINETITRNNRKYVAGELEKAAPSLKNKPILKDHKNEVDAIVGKVVNSGYGNKAVTFEGRIMDNKIIEMIQDGRISSVSIGAKVNRLEKEKLDDGTEVTNVKGIEFLELSLIPVAGDPGASIHSAIAESYDLQNITEEVNDMVNEEKIKELQDEVASLKEVVKKFIKEQEELKASEEEKKENDEEKKEEDEKKEEGKPAEEPKEEDKKEEVATEERLAMKEEIKKIKEAIHGKGKINSKTEKGKVDESFKTERTAHGMSFWRER